jgi:hypothetical protein
MENKSSKLELLLTNIDTTSSLRKAILKQEAKRTDLQNLISSLEQQEMDAANKDRDMRDDVLKLFTKLSDENLDYDLIVNVLAKNFKLPVPSLKKVQKTDKPLDTISEEIVSFVSKHSDGVPVNDPVLKDGLVSQQSGYNRLIDNTALFLTLIAPTMFVL